MQSSRVSIARSGDPIGSGAQELYTKLFGQSTLTPGDNVYRRDDTKGQGALYQTDAASSD